jgi:hypothetical protein
VFGSGKLFETWAPQRVKVAEIAEEVATEKQSEDQSKPRGMRLFRPATICPRSIAAKRNLLILQIVTQQFNRFSDYPPEKLLGKLLGRFAARSSHWRTPIPSARPTAGTIGELCHRGLITQQYVEADILGISFVRTEGCAPNWRLPL